MTRMWRGSENTEVRGGRETEGERGEKESSIDQDKRESERERQQISAHEIKVCV